MSISVPIIIAHKGASGHAPENTLLAFSKAVNLGAQMIELDVHETADGELVCIHDSSVDRTTNGSGEISKLTYKELQRLDAGQGEHIPLLDDALRFASGKIQVNIELKVIGVEKKVLETADQNGMLQNIILSSFIHDVLIEIRNFDETVKTAVLINYAMDDIVPYSLDLKANAINPHHGLVTPKLVQESHNAGLNVYPWTVNDPRTMANLFVLDIDGLITDYPDRALEILKNRI